MTLDDSSSFDFPTRNSRAEAISRQYGALYEEVVAWFDAGYPAGEIERAYRLGKEQECDASDIFAMLDAGMDWRDIAKALDPMPDTGDDDDEESPRRPRRRR